MLKPDFKVLSDHKFNYYDKKFLKKNNWWIFTVCGYSHQFSGNERALFEKVKDNPKIKKIILIRSKKIYLLGINVQIIPLNSFLAQYYITKSKFIFIKHSIGKNISYPIDLDSHYVINLWHGVPIKRIGYASLDFDKNRENIARQHKYNNKVICSSKVDKVSMTIAFYPLTYQDVWLTGLPRHDFILSKKSLLPAELKQNIQKLKHALNDKKLILFTPTFRESNKYYKFSKKEKRMLSLFLEKNNYILGVREHSASKVRYYSSELSFALDLNEEYYPHIEIIYRYADLLITDYSSCFVDFMLTNKPVISFAFDFDFYANKERGFFYDFKTIFPGKICYSFNSLMKALEHIKFEQNKQYSDTKKMFFTFNDDKNTDRLIKKINSICLQ